MDVDLCFIPLQEQGFAEVYRGPDRSFLVKRLQPGVRYTTKVLAINDVGEGPSSAVSAFTTQATVPVAPASPTQFAATAVRNGLRNCRTTDDTTSDSSCRAKGSPAMD